ncbi:MAG TPA: OPT/YSL family transporter, partial [Anaeromyxobacteraceae bacterium]|nr:OPT/YSL family transporter [Anaeromyxobacteraceae bacterium]
MPSPPTPPPARRELTARAVAVAVLVAALMGAAEPLIVLKIGYGPNLSVVSAFLGFVVLGALGWLTGARGSRWENNLVQTAGTSAGAGVGFMAVLLAAIDLLDARGLLSIHLTPLQIFAWLAPAGILGVLLAVPLRRHFLDEEDLPFADGTAAGQTLCILDERPEQAGPRLAALGLGGLTSAALAFLREGLRWLPGAIPFTALTPHAAALRLGVEVGVLSVGAGMLVGLRVALSMGLGMLLAWVVAPAPLVAHGIATELSFNGLLQRFTMWPATGLMVAGGLTALAVNWRAVTRSFAGLADRGGAGDDLPMRWVIAGSVAAATTLALVQWRSLGFPIWLTLVSIALSFLLMLVGIRVLGETNWAPISAMANVMQAVFAVLVPGHVPVNMIGSGMSGTIAGNGEHLMQDYRAGKVVGSSNRNLTLLQLLGVPVGALALAVVYPAARARFGVGGEGGLTSPISVKWAGFAELLSNGFGALPRSAFVALVLALVVGVALTLAEATRAGRWLPSPTAVGIGMLIPAWAVAPRVVGGAVTALWRRLHGPSEQALGTPL